MDLEEFNRALDAMKSRGDNEPELAQKMGISRDTLGDYRRGRFPKNIARLLQFPSLIEALAKDAEILQTGRHAQRAPGQAGAS